MMRHVAVIAFGVCLGSSAFAPTTTFTAPVARVGSNVPVTLTFPVARSGDTSYPAIVELRTVDGTAIAGIDYTAATGNLLIPAGLTSATVSVELSAATGGGSKTFQLVLEHPTGIGPAPSYSAEQAFNTGLSPSASIAADINGDGVADLIVANSQRRRHRLGTAEHHVLRRNRGDFFSAADLCDRRRSVVGRRR